MRKTQQTEKTVTQKANKVLTITFCIFALITIRIWYLCVIEHETLVARARQPQTKTIQIKANRGTITDRFGVYLARNKIQYNASILYAPIRQVPRTKWVLNENGDKVKVYTRKEHIANLSEKIAKIVSMSALDVEDLIYSKAALFPNVPYPIKEDITEAEYYQLKAIEKDWPGLHAESVSKRYYPKGRTAGSVIGYMGAISKEEYQAVLQEKEELELILRKIEQGLPVAFPEKLGSIPEVWNRLLDIRERAYSFHDRLGKGGVEGLFEEDLRGFHGLKSYYSDSQGYFLKELPGRKDPIPGKKISLTISAELQEHAERLLTNNEWIREGKSREFDWDTRRFVDLKQPWIKGGAIVALDPSNGEVLALASYPRFDPRDFIEDRQRSSFQSRIENINRWFETDRHLESLWEGEVLLERETLSSLKQKDVSIEAVKIDWKRYLDFVLTGNTEVKNLLENEIQLHQAVSLIHSSKTILLAFPGDSLGAIFNQLFPEHKAYPLKQKIPEAHLLDEELITIGRSHYNLLASLSSNYEKVFALDLMRILFHEEKLDEEILAKIGTLSLGKYRDLSLAFFAIERSLRKDIREYFQAIDFAKWREEHFSSFLKEKRREEEEQNSYAKPWVDYLEKEEQRQFKEFWHNNKWYFFTCLIQSNAQHLPRELAPYVKKLTSYVESPPSSLKQLQEVCKSFSTSEVQNLLQSFRHYSGLKGQLWGLYPNVRKHKHIQTEQDLAAAFYPIYGFNYSRSHAYQLSSVLGSIFKLVTAYTGLIHNYLNCDTDTPNFNDLNPLVITDRVERLREGVWRIGYWPDGTPIPQIYKRGRLPRSAGRNFGKLDVIQAIAVSSNPYFSLLTTEVLPSPLLLRSAAELFSFGNKTGINLPGEFSGRLPEDLEINRTGAYTFSIGQHTFLATPLQASLEIATVINGGYVFVPKVISSISGQDPERNPAEVLYQNRYPFTRELQEVGIHFPLFTRLLHPKEDESAKVFPSKVRRQIPLPPAVRNIILEGMQEVVHGKKGSARKAIIRNYRWDHPAYQDYLRQLPSLMGKTSTSQVPDRVGVDLDKASHMYKSIWFGGAGMHQIKTENEEAIISIPGSRFGQPDIVVVAYLRYGDAGHEAVPLVASMIEKWHSIKADKER